MSTVAIRPDERKATIYTHSGYGTVSVKLVRVDAVGEASQLGRCIEVDVALGGDYEDDEYVEVLQEEVGDTQFGKMSARLRSSMDNVLEPNSHRFLLWL